MLKLREDKMKKYDVGTKLLFSLNSMGTQYLGNHREFMEGDILRYSPNGKYIEMNVYIPCIRDVSKLWYRTDNIEVLDILEERLK